MIKIFHEQDIEEVTKIEVGDIFHVDGYYLQLIKINTEKYGLLDLEDSSMFHSELNHINHAINTIKKHYGDFNLIKSSRISVTIKP